jgi:CBS domain-containing protein
LVVYGLISDKIQEIAAGGIDMKFKDTASDPLQTSELLGSDTLHLDPGDTLSNSGDTLPEDSLSKGELSEMPQKILESIPHGGPKALTMKLRDNYYSEQGVTFVLKELSQLPNFRFVVVLDELDRLISYAPVWALGNLSRKDEEPEMGFLSLPQLVNDINDGQQKAVTSHPQMKTETVSIHTSNTKALEKMVNVNLEAIAVVDDKGHFRGVVERNRIVSQKMVALATGVKGKG